MANRAKQVETSAAPIKGVPQKPEPIQQTHVSGLGPVRQLHSARVQRKLSGPADILPLQQTIGNQAVMRLLDKQRSGVQAKLAESSEEESVQRMGEGQREPSEVQIHAAAAEGIRSQATTLPYLDGIVQQQAAGIDHQGNANKCNSDPLPDAAEAWRGAEESHPPQGSAAKGLPGQLKSGVEELSGLSMENVRVHYNSSKPAELKALAYAQGTEIYLMPGQEKHLPHEAWHIVQQAQGKVQATTWIDGKGINNDARLELEADTMGERALILGGGGSASDRHSGINEAWNQQREGSHLIAPLPLVRQRKSLGQYSVPDLIKEGEVILKSNDGPDAGNLYSRNQPTVNNRDQALKQVMEELREIGSIPPSGFLAPRTITGIWSNMNLVSKNGILNSLDEDLIAEKEDLERLRKHLRESKKIEKKDVDLFRNNSMLQLTDPFQLLVRVKYSPQNEVLEIKAEFGDAYNGYIISIKDSGNGVYAFMASTGTISATDTSIGIPGTYSNIHHVQKGGSQKDRIQNIGKMATKFENEKGIDAYTKVIGEGARFNCVASLGTKIADDTKFYYRMSDKEWSYISFEGLWSNWASFGKKFGIKDDDVIASIKGNLAQTRHVYSTTNPNDLLDGYDLGLGRQVHLPIVSRIFKVDFKSRPGQRLFITGDTPELGRWNPNEAIALSSWGTDTWGVKVRLASTRSGELQYKYLAKEGTGVRWEEGGNHRHILYSAVETVKDKWHELHMGERM